MSSFLKYLTLGDDDEIVKVREVCDIWVWRNIKAWPEESQCPLLSKSVKLIYSLFGECPVR